MTGSLDMFPYRWRAGRSIFTLNFFADWELSDEIDSNDSKRICESLLSSVVSFNFSHSSCMDCMQQDSSSLYTKITYILHPLLLRLHLHSSISLHSKSQAQSFPPATHLCKTWGVLSLFLHSPEFFRFWSQALKPCFREFFVFPLMSRCLSSLITLFQTPVDHDVLNTLASWMRWEQCRDRLEITTL